MANLDGRVLNSQNIGLHVGLAHSEAPTASEEPVQTMWNGIMAEWFPQKEGFLLNVKAAVLADDTKPDIVIVEFQQPLQGSLLSRQILILECKRVSDNTAGGWENAQVQLAHYLDENANSNQSTRIYGAVAIGTAVRFYNHQLGAPQANGRRAQGILGYLNPQTRSFYNLRDPSQRVGLEAVLDFIKANGFNNAS